MDLSNYYVKTEPMNYVLYKKKEKLVDEKLKTVHTRVGYFGTSMEHLLRGLARDMTKEAFDQSEVHNINDVISTMNEFGESLVKKIEGKQLIVEAPKKEKEADHEPQ